MLLASAPPSLVSFLIPWSPGGMLLQKVNARTWGYLVVIGCSMYLLYYSFQIQWSWWAAQPVVADTGLIYHQVLIGTNLAMTLVSHVPNLAGRDMLYKPSQMIPLT